MGGGRADEVGRQLTARAYHLSALPANEVGRQLTRAHPTSSALPPIPPVPPRANEVGRQLTKYMDFFRVPLVPMLFYDADWAKLGYAGRIPPFSLRIR